MGCLYAGGMTEEKKIQRRKDLAKWLKETILRLGPTFIKIGQQFSTRVDILAQEYVDQLSELQVKIIVLKHHSESLEPLYASIFSTITCTGYRYFAWYLCMRTNFFPH